MARRRVTGRGALLLAAAMALVPLLPTPAAQAVYGSTGTAQREAWPFLVKVDAGGKEWCGGTLIRNDYVLTAAHCFQPGVITAKVIFHAGFSGSYTVETATPRVRPGWVRDGQFVNDVALLRLKRTVNEPTLPLAATEPPVGSTVTIAGYGCTERPQYGGPCTTSNTLRAIAMKVATDSHCPLQDSASHICTGSDTSVAREGDSGGPVVWLTGGTRKLAGVVSTVLGGGPPYANSHASVPTQAAWINSILNPPAPTPAPAPGPAPNRTAVTSYDRMAAGAPHNGYFASAFQPFTAQSNTLTYAGVTIGTKAFPGGAPTGGTVLVRVCTSPSCTSIVAARNVPIVNYGNSAVDLGDVPVSRGSTYYLVWYQPPAASGNSWVTYWWAGGAGITTSDQMQAVVRGYNR